MTKNSILPFVVADATTTTIGRITPTPTWGIGIINSRSNFGVNKFTNDNNSNTYEKIFRMKKASRKPLRHNDSIKNIRRIGSNERSNTIADFQNGIVSHIVEGLDIELSHGWRF